MEITNRTKCTEFTTIYNKLTMNRDSSTDRTEREMESHISVETALKLLEGFSKGMIGEEIETITMEGLRVVQAQKGFIRCHFLVPNSVAVSVTYFSLINHSL